MIIFCLALSNALVDALSVRIGVNSLMLAN